MARRNAENDPPPDPHARLELSEAGDLRDPTARAKRSSKGDKLREFLGLKAIEPARGKARAAKPAGPVIEEHLAADSPWRTDPEGFPAAQGMEAKLRFCLHFAVLAPSSHNSQPWQFEIDGRTCDVYADRTKALAVSDPEDRELTISCGCALWFLRTALRRYGLEERVKLLPDARKPDLLARVTVVGAREARIEDRRLFEAILSRRTVRKAFEPRAVPASLVRELVEIAGEAGGGSARFVPVAGEEPRKRLARLVHEADVIQLGNRAFRRELAMWMHHNRTHSADGLPGYALGMSELESLAAPLVVRTFDTGEGRGAKDEQLALHSPLLAVLGSERDDAEAWLNTGQALGAVLLRATLGGVSASYLNQPVEQPELRVHLKRLMPEIAWPQLVLRMGFGPAVGRTPRRGVGQVLRP
jgi:nitroreductase